MIEARLEASGYNPTQASSVLPNIVQLCKHAYVRPIGVELLVC